MKKSQIMIIRIAAASVITAVTAILQNVDSLPLPLAIVLYAIALLAVGYDIIWSAIQNIFHLQLLDENFLMTIATIGAFFIGEYVDAVIVMILYQIGELFQQYAVGQSRKSIQSLVSIRPESATLLIDGVENEVHPSQIAIGDTFVVRPGERIALDGVVVSGNCAIDTSAITGESIPLDCKEGQNLLSGCICLNGVLTIKATSTYDNSTVAKILDLVENATFNKAPTEKFITKFSKYYTPIVVALAVIIGVVPPLFNGLWTVWLKRAMMFLFVSCPCALVISVPLSFFGGISASSKKGILVKGGNYLELLAKIDTVAFDKTGTLTKGIFEIANVFPQENSEQVLDLAVIAEQYSNHPIALSICKGRTPSSAASITEIPGKGIVAECGKGTILCGNKQLMQLHDVKVDNEPIGTVVYVALNNLLIGHVIVADSVKTEAQTAINQLRQTGTTTLMLTGDNNATAQSIANQLGIYDYKSQLLPQDKATIVKQLQNDGKTVAFVGDGINDAPAFATSNLAIAMGAMGSDIAIETADVVLMHDDLTAIATAKQIAKKTLAIVKQNIVISLVVKFVVLMLATFGILDKLSFGLVIAILADVGVCFVAILNAMRTTIIRKK